MTLPVGLLMALCIAGATVAVWTKNILHAVFGLAITLLGIAGLFLYLGSPFLAAMEVLIYVGGISVAMVFAVMLSYSISAQRQSDGAVRRLVGAVPAVLFVALMSWVIVGSEFGPAPAIVDEAWSLARVGHALLTHYNLVFEMLSVILLLAIIGALSIARIPEAGDEEAAP